MRAELSTEQQELQAVAVRLAAALAPRSVQELPGGPPADGWAQLHQTGLAAVHLPGAVGGGGGGLLELSLAVEAFGRHLCATPLLGASLALLALHEAGADDLLGAALAGRARPVLAIVGPTAPDAAGADLVVGVDDGRCTAGAAVPVPGLADRSRAAARAAPGGLRAGRALDEAARDRVQAATLVLLAADLVGTADGALHEAVAYATERRQFGVAIASFQAVRHLLADAHVGLAAARGLVRAAAWRGDQSDPAGLALARSAHVVAADAGLAACETAVQVLGGLGHTWEHLAGVRLRRALASRAAGGDSVTTLARSDHALPSRPGGRASASGYDLRDDDVEAAVREELRAWLAAHPGPPADADLDRRAEWHRALGAAGWIGVSMPREAGGRGLPPTCEAIVNEELALARRPPPPPVGHLAAALAGYGTAAQQAEHLAGLLSGRVRWCQGFSEPDAGSDLASLTTTARLQDDRWVVRGAKTWTSEAAWASWCLLLCRTEPDRPRHRGLSVLLVPLDAPGVTVRPFATAWGSPEFADVTFDDAAVPAGALLGRWGQGWEIAMALLAVERGPAEVGWIARLRLALDGLDRRDPHAVRAGCWLAALEARVAETLTGRAAGRSPGVEGSVDKLLMTRVDQQLGRVVLDQATRTALPGEGPELERYLWSRAAGVFGGTTQIQRNIVADRVLGLGPG